MEDNPQDLQAEYLLHLQKSALRAGISADLVGTPVEGWIDLSGLRFHYLEWGSEKSNAPPLVLLHGAGLNAHTWDMCALLLRPAHRCYALDLRGHGDSQWSSDGTYPLEAHIADVLAFIDQLQLAHCILVGMSLGGQAAVGAALERSDIIDALVVVDASPQPDPTAARPGPLSEFYRVEFFESLEQAIAHAASFNPRRSRESLRYSLRRNLRTLPDGRLTWKADLRRRLPAAGAALAEYKAVLWERLTRLTCPTLVVRGAQSDILTAERAAAFAAKLPRGRLETIPNAGHNVQSDNPVQLVATIEDFIG